jgi:hypothetical protein
LVEKFTVKPYWSEQCKVMTKEYIDWKAIGAELNRVPKSCWHKWRAIQESQMIKGCFSLEEDVVIMHRVGEWGDKGKGLWVSLEKELNRPATHIQRRWKTCCKNNST